MDGLHPPPEVASCGIIYVPRKKKLTMKVTKIRPDIEDTLEATVIASKDHILIVVNDDEVEVKSTLDDKESVFYIELCKQLMIEGWLCGNSTK